MKNKNYITLLSLVVLIAAVLLFAACRKTEPQIPSENKDAKLISRVERIDDNIKAIAGGAGKKGTGGFITKIKAAEIAVNAGIPVVITNGSRPTDIYHILRNQQTGTYFEAVKND